jgi:hypothetical protein
MGMPIQIGALNSIFELFQPVKETWPKGKNILFKFVSVSIHKIEKYSRPGLTT